MALPSLLDHVRAPVDPPSAHAKPELAGWAARLGPPALEPRSSRIMAHLGGLASIGALLVYLSWRIVFTLPSSGANLAAAWLLVGFETLPLAGLVIKLGTLWNIDSRGPAPVTSALPGQVVLLIPTYNEPVEVLVPTVAAACALEPAHETWVLDDGDREWVADMCRAYGARYVSRPVHDHAKAGNMNHAFDLMAAEADAGVGAVEFIAVLDCDHVPLPNFLTATLGWFEDDRIALVQAPQAYYNSGAFDDDGHTGEQGMFFNVLLPARNHADAGPFWCGSTSVLRLSALREVGGVSTETIVEDMHTTLNLIRAGWRTVYHNQTVALGLAPATPEQYLLQRRRWGMGSMQVLTHEKLWAAKRWLSWRNYYEYLTGTLWWLEGIATLLIFTVPAIIMVSGAKTSTAGPLTFGVAFLAMFSVRLWGAKRLLRKEIHWPTAFALRIFRVPIGLACFWWLITRQTLQFQVTPKGAADSRVRGRSPRILWVLITVITTLLAYAFAGALGLVPWRSTAGATAASGVWLMFADVVLILGTLRICSEDFATSRRNAYRAPTSARVFLDGRPAELVNISVGGACVRVGLDQAPLGSTVDLVIGTESVRLSVLRAQDESNLCTLSLRVADDDWKAYRVVSLLMFHTPDHLIRGLPSGVPAVALRGRS